MSLLKEKIELNVQEAELFAQKNLGSFPPVLRWLLVFMVLAIIPAYYISRSVSQKIWLARYEQGAIAGKPSFTNPQAPKISNVTLTVSGSNSLAAVVQISNQNLDLSIDNVPYTFTFYNSQKQQIYQYQNTLFLLPNQTKYVTAPTFTPTETIAYANFQLPQTLPWQKRLAIPTVNLSTSLPQTFEQTSPLAFVAQGDFVNNSPYTLSKVHLTFVLFDQSGNIIGASQRDEFTVAPFERRAYKQLWPNMIAPNLSRIDLTADTDTLDPDNLSAPAINSNSSSNLSRPATKQY
jgi:hypothetical protein